MELVEVGSTNRTYVRDYAAAITERTAAVMLIHRSNFQVTGFVHDPEIGELAALAHAKGILLIDDLGSGTFLDTERYGLAHEPKVQERVAAGADLVCFSGDKLLGGPQAGYIVGRQPLIDTLKKVPMLRALRVDKVTLAGIEATLRHYVRGEPTVPPCSRSTMIANSSATSPMPSATTATSSRRPPAPPRST